MIVRFKIPVYAHILSGLLFLLAGSRSDLRAQTPATALLTAAFEKDTVPISNGHTFSNILHVKNGTNQKIRLYLDVTSQKIQEGYLPLPDSLVLSAGEQALIPLKFLASARLIKEAVTPFTAEYHTAAGAMLKAVFYTQLNEETKVLLQLLNPLILLDRTNDQAQASFYISNEGLLPRTVTVNLTAYPEGLEIAGNHQPVTLEAGTRRLLTYSLHSRLRKSDATDFSLVVQLADEGGQILGSGDMRVQTLSSNKQAFTSGPSGSAQPGNALELSYVNMSRYLSYTQLRAGGGTGLADSSRIDYHVTTEYYTHPHGFNIYDSWLAYQNPHFYMRVGSITDNLDYAINGNGFQSGISIDKKNSLEVFGVKNNYLLYSQVLNALPGADIVAGRYNFSTKPLGLQLSVLHANDPLLNVYTNLFHHTGRLRTGDNQELQWEGGFSTEQPRDRSGIHYGYAGGLRYRATLPRWLITLSNYYSSPYYGGIRRGALDLEDEADYKLDGANQLFGRLSRSYNSPKYTPSTDSLVFATFNYNNTNIYETGWRRRAGKITAVLHPYYMDQRLYSALVSQKSGLQSRSDRLALDLNFAGNRKSFFISSDIGATRSDSGAGRPQHYTSLRLLGNYIQQYWSFSYLLQWRPYYLTDQLLSHVPQDFRLYSFGPALHLPFLHDRAEVNMGYNANYYSTQRLWTHSLNGQVNLALKNSWTLNGQLYYTIYHAEKALGHAYTPYSPNNQQLRVGLIKRFTTGRLPGTVHLRLILFSDANGNGEQDNEEKTARDVIVRLDGQATISDGRGKVEYSNLSRAIHQLTIDNGPEWNLAAPLSLPLTHDQTIRIPLVKSGRLNGRIVIDRQKYENVEPDKEGIKVEAHGRNGKIFTTYTDFNGLFHFYLPVMEYEITVQPTNNAGAASQKVAVTAGATTDTEFHMEDRRRKIEVKQF